VDAVPETRNASVRWLVETVAFHVHRSARAASIDSPLAMFAHLPDGRGALKHAGLFLVEAGDATHGCAVADGDCMALNSACALEDEQDRRHP
jgi:hypothetical protein